MQLTQRFVSSSTNFNTRKVSHGNLQTICTDLVEQERTKHFRIGYINAQSCRNKSEEIFDLIIEKNIDIQLITETWLAQHGDDVTIQNLTPSYFICKSFTRPNRRGGGIAIIYKNILQRKLQIKLNLSFDHTSFEAAEFSIDQGFKFFQVICIYRPPYSGSNKLSPAVFINEFEQLLCSLSSKSRHTIILGDFNLHFDSDSSNDVNRMKDLINQCSMEKLIFNSTHRAGHILDCVVVKKDYKTVDNVAVLDHLLSDHCSIIIDLDVKKAIPINRCITTRNLKGIDIDQLRSDLRAIHTDDINLYNNELKALVDKPAPLVTRGVSYRPYAPWYDSDVKSAKCECRRAERLWLKTGLTIHK